MECETTGMMSSLELLMSFNWSICFDSVLLLPRDVPKGSIAILEELKWNYRILLTEKLNSVTPVYM